MRFISYIILNKPLICNSNAPRIHLKSSSNLSRYWLFCCRISGKDFLFSSCQIFKEKSCHEPEWSKIQPDHVVDVQHPPGVIPRTYTKAFQECSRKVFCEKNQDHVQDPMAEDPVFYRDPSPVSDPAVHPFPDGTQQDAHSIYREHVHRCLSHEFHVSRRESFHGGQKDLKSPSRQTAEHEISDPRFPSAAGSISHCNFLIFVFLIPSVHETSICDSPIHYAAFSTVHFSTFIFPRFMPWKVRISRLLYTY